MIVSLRLSEEEWQTIKDKATHRGMTFSGLIRDMIRSDREYQVLVASMKEFMKSQEQKTVALQGEFRTMATALAEAKRTMPMIYRRVDLLANASPIVSKQLSEMEGRR